MEKSNNSQFKKIINNPFKYYCKMMGLTFGFVFLTNTCTTLFDERKRSIIGQHPDLFAMSLATKSCYYGILWPGFYLTAIKYPKNAFILWSGVEEGLKDLEDLEFKRYR